MTAKQPQKFTLEFKQSLIDSYAAGEDISAQLAAHGIKQELFMKWWRYFKKHGTLQPLSELTEEQKEILRLRKLLQEKDKAIEILTMAKQILDENRKNRSK